MQAHTLSLSLPCILTYTQHTHARPHPHPPTPHTHTKTTDASVPQTARSQTTETPHPFYNHIQHNHRSLGRREHKSGPQRPPKGRSVRTTTTGPRSVRSTTTGPRSVRSTTTGPTSVRTTTTGPRQVSQVHNDRPQVSQVHNDRPQVSQVHNDRPQVSQPVRSHHTATHCHTAATEQLQTSGRIRHGAGEHQQTVSTVAKTPLQGPAECCQLNSSHL